MRELRNLATSKKIFHTLGHSSLLSPFRPFGHLGPPIWPPLAGHIFICISDEVVQSYFSRPISLKFAGNLQQIQVYRKVAKWAEGRQEAAVSKCVKEFFWSGQNLQFTHDLFQFYQAFATKKFVGWENYPQSWNPCFLGVRSPVWLFKSGGDPV